MLHLLILYLAPRVAIGHFLLVVTKISFSLCSFGATIEFMTYTILEKERERETKRGAGKREDKTNAVQFSMVSYFFFRKLDN